MNNSRKPINFDIPASYRICIEGPLDPRWSDYLSGMTICQGARQGDSTVVTTLTGELTDMAALMGVLNTVYDLGHMLLEVQRLPVPDETGSNV